MQYYIHGDYVYVNNSIYAPKEHNKNLILNQKPNFYITSLSTFMDDTYTSFPKLFFDEMIKIWTKSHIKVVTQLSKFVRFNKENQQMEQMYIER